jgi:pantothenate kinase-related protein Tda10
MEDWKNGRMEEWNIGIMDEWKNGILEEWEIGVAPIPLLEGVRGRNNRIEEWKLSLQHSNIPILHYSNTPLLQLNC